MLKTVSSITNAIGALNFKGTWNATTNTPTIVSGVGVKGDYFVVSVAGSTTIDGISNWGIGDWIVYNGNIWQRVEGGADLNGVNLSVSGTTNLSGLTASTALALNATKDVVSVTNTGTGDNVLATSPSLVTPNLGAASATSINKVALTTPATGSTLTIADGKTLTANNSLTLAGADATTMTFPTTTATIARTDAGQTFTGTQEMTSPKIITSINDTNNNEVVKITAIGSAVNEVTIANAATNNPPVISATGSDTNIGIVIQPKGSGQISCPARTQILNRIMGSNVDFNNGGTGRTFTVSGGSNGDQTYFSFTAYHKGGVSDSYFYCTNSGGNWSVVGPITNTAGSNPPTITTSGSGTATLTVNVKGAGPGPADFGGGILTFEFFNSFVTFA
jgi:hypothetical protein